MPYIRLLLVCFLINTYLGAMDRIVDDGQVPSLALQDVRVEQGDSLSTQGRAMTTDRLILQALLQQAKDEKRKTEQRDAIVDRIEPHFYDALRLTDASNDAQLRAKLKALREEATAIEEAQREKLIKRKLKRMSGVAGLNIQDLDRHAQNLRAGVDEIYQGRLGDPTQPIDERSFKELAYQCVLARSKSAPRKRSEKQEKFIQRKDFLNQWFDRLPPEVTDEIMGVYHEATSNSEKQSSQRDVVPSIVSTLMSIEKNRSVSPDQLHSVMNDLMTEHLEDKNAAGKKQYWITLAGGVVTLLLTNGAQLLGWGTAEKCPDLATLALDCTFWDRCTALMSQSC